MISSNLRLKNKLNEIYSLQPNDLGINLLTVFYRKLTRPFQYVPFILIIPLSLFISVFLYLVFGPLLIKLVSILQYGS